MSRPAGVAGSIASRTETNCTLATSRRTRVSREDVLESSRLVETALLGGCSVKLDFIKDLYFKELEAKNQLDSRPTLLVGVLTVLGGLLFFDYTHMPRAKIPALAFLAFFLPAVVSYAMAVFLVIWAAAGHLYEKLPAPDVLYDYFVKLEKFHGASSESATNTQRDWDDFLARHMILAASRNTQSNLSRSSRYFNATRALSATVALAFISTVIALVAELLVAP